MQVAFDPKDLRPVVGAVVAELADRLAAHDGRIAYSTAEVARMFGVDADDDSRCQEARGAGGGPRRAEVSVNPAADCRLWSNWRAGRGVRGRAGLEKCVGCGGGIGQRAPDVLLTRFFVGIQGTPF
jgi:hypothetical protein